MCERRHIAGLALGALVALLVVANLPPSGFRRTVLKAGDPLLTAAGLRQPWDVFAPDPRQVSFGLVVRFRYADGPPGRWTPPRDGPRILSGDRWVKLAEHADGAAAGPDLLAWAIREHADTRRRLVGAELLRVARPVAPVGEPESAAPPRREEVLWRTG